MKTELNPTNRPTGDSRQYARFDTLRAGYGREGVSAAVGWFGAISRPTVRPTNPRVA